MANYLEAKDISGACSFRSCCRAAPNANCLFLVGARRTGPGYTNVPAPTTGGNSVVAVDAIMPSKPNFEADNAKKKRVDRLVTKKREEPPGEMMTYKTRRMVSLREEPRFAATSKAQIGAGTS